MAAPDDSGEVILRSYQLEMLKASIADNAIVVVREKWSEQRLWDATLRGVQIVIGTPAVLNDALHHGFVRISGIRLLVFDEAHNAVKSHPMNSIMFNFYHRAKVDGIPVPKIVGLTASPTFSAKEGSLKQLEANLDAKATTPKQWLEELNKHVYPPEVTVISYDADSLPPYPGKSRLCELLDHSVRDYDLMGDPYIIELASQSSGSQNPRLTKALATGKTTCTEQLSTLARQLRTIYEKLGPSIAESYFCRLLNVLKAKSDNGMLITDLPTKESRHVMRTLEPIYSVTGGTTTENELPVLAGKAETLVKLLVAETSPSIRGIIFVKERVIATELARLLSLSNVLAKVYRTGVFVGTSTFANRKGPLPELVDPKQQEGDLAAFRVGAKNLIVATSVLQEGIDVSACDLVVNFDLPETLVGFVQRRGRARQKGSKYYMFVASNDSKTDPLKWKTEEANMVREYMDADRARAEAEAEDAAELATKIYRIPSTNALLTTSNAKAHLHHFCAVSTMATNYVDRRPTFYARQEAREVWTASVVLPSYVHPNVREAHSPFSWRSEAAAIKDAAFEAYVSLYKAGLVNDNLLPLSREYGPDDITEEKDRSSMVTVMERQNSWSVLANALASSEMEWHSTNLTVMLPNGRAMSVTALLPTTIDQGGHFVLHWNEKLVLSAQYSASEPASCNGAPPETMQHNTYILLRNRYGSRMQADVHTDFLMYLDLPGYLREGSHNALEKVNSINAQDDFGLIHVGAHGSKAFMLQRIADSNGQLEAVATLFPKRKDFLHAVPERNMVNAAYSREERFPLTDCTMDSLPQDYAIFAALIPSIMHRLDVALLVQNLQSAILKDVQIDSISLITEAISAPSAGEDKDYNRLEYLGDAILKLCAHLQVMARHPTWPEGFLTRKKGYLVGNRNLSKAALSLGLDKYILTKPFTGAKWRPPYASEVLAKDDIRTREMSTKTLADVMEALIGAAFVDGGLSKAHTCIQTLLPRETWFPAAEIFDRLGPQAQQPTQDLSTLERLIGHEFCQKSLLLEAVTHASLPFQLESSTSMSYERLEFLGDSVLDLILVPKLHAHSPPLGHGDLHSYHEALVNGLFLGYGCMAHHIELDVTGVVSTEDGFDITVKKHRMHLHDFIRAGGQLLTARQKAIDAFDTYQHSIRQALEEGVEYPWADLTALMPREYKFFSDIIEAILGAIYIDTRGDLTACEKFLERLGVLHYMQIMLERRTIVMNPKERVGILSVEKSVEYVKLKIGPEKNGEVDVVGDAGSAAGHGCTVKVGDVDVATAGPYSTYKEAEMRAACKTIDLLSSELANSLHTVEKATIAQPELTREYDSDSSGIEISA
ncbi:Ribonuclease III domain-containing protein [Elsinoe fawcettii]|nr:Ribonuclease III domain-containing protein [Elsinoe fawcettii]